MDQSLKEAWSRLANQDYTIEDLLLILDSVKEDDHLQEFYEVDDGVWNNALASALPLTKEREQEYRQKAAQLLAAYERKKEATPVVMTSPRTGQFRKLFYAAAAAVMLGLLIPSAYFYMKPKTEPSIPVEMATLLGEVKSVTLPDATIVTLNVGSRIIYPDKFSADDRIVELYGEALFEVTSDPERPFIVKNDNMQIRVLGTVFDIKAYTEDIYATVSVVSGTVEVDLKGGKALLEQNQQVKINKVNGHFEKHTVDAQKYALWTSGSLYFNLTPIQEVVNMLNRYYPEIKVELAPGEYPNLISGEHENESLHAVLTSIVYSTGLQCKKQGNKYTISPKK